MRRSVFGSGCLLVLLLLVGCGEDGPKVVNVAGRATHNGEPVPGIMVSFQPDKGRPSWGITDKDGKFTLEYDEKRKGAQVGGHTVSAMYHNSTPEQEMMPDVKRNATAKQVVAKYSDPAKGLKVSVTEATENFELKFE